MIKIFVPSLPQRSYEYRRGDSQVIYDDNKNAIVIDGGESELFNILLSYCESVGITHVTVISTHWHPDHDCGLKALLNSKLIVDKIYCPPIDEVKTLVADDGVDDYSRGIKIINLAKSLNKTIICPEAGKFTTIQVGDIKCELWRRKANKNDFTDYQVNNTSIQAYFPDIQYLTGGDMINTTEYLNLLKSKGKKVKWFKIWHHGNSCTTNPCELLKSLGAALCWYNDWEPIGTSIGGTGFSHYGAGYCKKYFTTLPTINTIVATADDKKLYIKYGKTTYTFDVPYVSGNWEQDDKGWKYKKEGIYLSNGAYEIGNKWYYFDKDGYRETGWVKGNDGKYRWCNPHMFVNKWIVNDDKKYYVDGYGRRYDDGSYLIEDKWYYFDKDGALLTGWVKARDEKLRWCDPYMFVNRWAETDGKKYYLDGYGRPYVNGAHKIDNKWYYFDKDGALLTGWVKASDNQYRWCNPYMVVKQWITINDKKYYVDDYGRRIDNRSYKIDSKWYYFDKNGAMLTGWIKPDEYKRYLDPATGVMVVRTTRMIDGVNYRFDEYGRAFEETNATEATKSSLNGIDISSYQAGIDLSKVTLDFCVVKATQGTTYVNPDFARAMKQLIDNNKLMGIYHYANGSGATAEADHFISKVRPYLSYNPVLALDWEGEQNAKFGKDDVAYCKTFLDRVYAKTGIKPVIYMSKGITRKYNWTSVVNAGYKLWCAQYASNNTTGYRTNPWTDSYSFGAWGKPVIYQYSSKGKLDNWNGNLDLDLFYGSEVDWKSLGGAVVRQ